MKRTRDVIVELPHSVRAVSLDELLAMDLPKREYIVEPWLPLQGLTMLYGTRGIGKTLLAMTLAYAIASGRDLFTWHVPRPFGVLYLDGEMPAPLMRERFAHIVAAFDWGPQASLRIITPDLQPNGTPDLATIDGQQAVNAEVHDDIDLIVVDNLSACVRLGDENTAMDWQPIQDWLLSLRARGKSVMLLHHAGKAGQQRGTSRREDALDSTLMIRRPAGYTPADGAHFELHYDKLRGSGGAQAQPLKIQLQADGADRWLWTHRTLEQSLFEKVTALLAEEYSQKDIAIELGINKATVCKYAKRAAQGELP